MTRIPPHSGEEMIAALKRAGFQVTHQKGDHVFMFHPAKKSTRPIVVPLYDDLPPFIISNNLKTAGMSRKEYSAFLGRGNDKKRKHS